MLLRKTYYQNLTQLRVKREKAELEVAQLRALRQVLVQKNLAGTYSDEVYQEQNKLIENKLADTQTVLDQVVFDKYNIDDIDNFMREKFKDLGETYQTSDLGERRVLLVSIAPSGLDWCYSGLSKQKIGPLYQSIIDIERTHFALSTAYGS